MDETSVHASTISIHFDKDEYVVHGPGETIDAVLLIDGQLTSPEDDPIAKGLFSYAVRLDFDGTKAQLAGVADISVPSELENFGFSSGAFREVSLGMGGVKGNIDQNSSPLDPYFDARLATFQITNLASAPDSYPLDLDFFRTLGVNEQFFLDGQFSLLDADIQFRSSRVLVVPEPFSHLSIVAGCLLCWVLLRERKCFRPR
jgi:hypothetical protein